MCGNRYNTRYNVIMLIFHEVSNIKEYLLQLKLQIFFVEVSLNYDYFPNLLKICSGFM